MSGDPLTADTATASPTRAPSTTAVLDALADSERRALLQALAANEGPIDETDLAARVATREHEDRATRATEREMHVRLHHVHLPKLAARNIVDRDRSASVVSKGEYFDYALTQVR